MLRSRLKGYVVVEYKWVFWAKFIALCFCIAAGYVVYALTDFSKTANAVEDDGVDKVKLVVMNWMKANSEMPEQVLSAVYDEAVKHPHTDLILAICAVESNFNPNAKSRKGAIGLMGILPSVWLNDLKENGIIRSKRDLYLMPKNIASGVHILKKYLLRSNDLTKALVDYVGGDPNYVNKVLKAMGEIYLAKMLNSSASS
jgi:hypothetical protein